MQKRIGYCGQAAYPEWWNSPGLAGLEAALAGGGRAEMFYWDKAGGAHVVVTLNDNCSGMWIVFNQHAKPTMISNQPLSPE